MSKKDSILTAAARLFAEKGFKETTVAELSKMTGAAEGTIFHHFKSKEDIFMSILQEMKYGIIQEFEGVAVRHPYFGYDTCPCPLQCTHLREPKSVWAEELI